MAKTARQVVDDAKTALLDETGVRWGDKELLDYLNDGQREIVKYKPEANTVNESVQLVAGTKQTLPAGAVCLIDLTRNMGADGATPGDIIHECPKKTLDAILPGWHKSIPSASALHFCFDERDSKTYYVYPPQPASGMGYVEQVRADNPTDCTLADHDGTSTGDSDSNLSLPDEYANDLYHFVLHRAHSKETEAASTQKAAFHLQAFGQGLGVLDLAEQKVEPRKSRRE